MTYITPRDNGRVIGIFIAALIGSAGLHSFLRRYYVIGSGELQMLTSEMQRKHTEISLAVG